MRNSNLEKGFTLEIIEMCETQAQANERERFLIKTLNCKVPNGYNQRDGGGVLKPRANGIYDMKQESIGILLRKIRTEISFTQRQATNQVGVTEATVSRWESGDIDNMRRDKIAGLANALKVSLLLIMGIENLEQCYRPVNGE